MRNPLAARMRGMPNDLHSPAEVLLDPGLAAACVALIYPEVLNTRELVVSSFQEQRHGPTVLDVGRVYLGAQYQTARIDQDVALAAVDTFRSVVATYAADTGRPDGLAIDDPSTRLRVTPDGGAELLPQDGVQVFPSAVQAPQPEIVIGGLPGCELVGQQSPGTATPNNIEDGVQDLADGVQAGSAEPLGWRQKRLEASELGVREVGQVWSPRGQTPAILPVKPTRVPVFRQFLVSCLRSS